MKPQDWAGYLSNQDVSHNLLNAWTETLGREHPPAASRVTKRTVARMALVRGHLYAMHPTLVCGSAVLVFPVTAEYYCGRGRDWVISNNSEIDLRLMNVSLGLSASNVRSVLRFPVASGWTKERIELAISGVQQAIGKRIASVCRTA